MPSLRYLAMPTAAARAFQAGAPDANGHPPERQVSDSSLGLCRHCLAELAPGEPYLVLAYRPFPAPQPYAEVGPIFLHAGPCDRHPETAGMPAPLRDRSQLLVRGYGRDDRIVYGTGQVVPAAALDDAASTLLAHPDVAYLHLRSASNNCYQCRVERA
jgi:hypothetical protein